MPAKIAGLGQVKEIDMSGLEPMALIGTRLVKVGDIASLMN